MNIKILLLNILIASSLTAMDNAHNNSFGISDSEINKLIRTFHNFVIPTTHNNIRTITLPSSSVGYISCIICKKSFKNIKGLRIHERIHNAANNALQVISIEYQSNYSHSC